MPSEHMKRHHVHLYPEQNDKLTEVLREHNLKTVRFLRECIIFVMANPSVLAEVISLSQNRAYRKVKR